jgi:protocatechuate 3,4-dioxygenase beta subunit
MDESGKPSKYSRRAALRTWLAGSASLTLLAAASALPLRSILAAPAEQTAGPAPAQVPAAAPSATGGSTAPATSAAPTTSPGSATSAAGAAASSAAQMCVLTREQTEGPYYIDVDLIRSDITEGKEGLPLQLSLTVLNAATCQPLPGATVEIWHCDAAGDYSGFSSSLPNMHGEPPGSDSGSPPPMRPGGPPPGGPGGPPPGGPPPGGMVPGSGPAMRNTPTNELVFLRGGQISDSAGLVTFQTIYPGWYRGRTVHVHLKVHAGGQEIHTSQLFFDDTTSDEVFSSPPYAAHAGRDTMNATDSIFQQGGQQGLVALTKADAGYTGTLTLGVQA